MMCARILLMLLLLVESSVVLAEGGCPAGMIPYSGTDISSCGPVPAGYYGENNADPSNVMPYDPVPAWKTTWGAIAFSKRNNAVGVASGMASKKTAQEAALADCQTAGGGALCEIGIAYYNQCAAVAWGDSFSNSAGAESAKIASDIALKRCNENSHGCKIVYSNCTEPVRIQ